MCLPRGLTSTPTLPPHTQSAHSGTPTQPRCAEVRELRPEPDVTVPGCGPRSPPSRQLCLRGACATSQSGLGAGQRGSSVGPGGSSPPFCSSGLLAAPDALLFHMNFRSGFSNLTKNSLRHGLEFHYFRTLGIFGAHLHARGLGMRWPRSIHSGNADAGAQLGGSARQSCARKTDVGRGSKEWPTWLFDLMPMRLHGDKQLRADVGKLTVRNFARCCHLDT